MTKTTDTSAISLLSCDEGFDPIEDRLRANIRGTIEAVFNEELDSFLGRLRYDRKAGAVKGYRHGTGIAGSPGHLAPRRSACRGPGSRTRRASPRMALESAAALSAPDKAGRGADRVGLPLGHQHAAGEARLVRVVQGGREQGCGEPGVAQGQDGLGRLVRAQPCR